MTEHDYVAFWCALGTTGRDLLLDPKWRLGWQGFASDSTKRHALNAYAFSCQLYL